MQASVAAPMSSVEDLLCRVGKVLRDHILFPKPIIWTEALRNGRDFPKLMLRITAGLDLAPRDLPESTFPLTNFPLGPLCLLHSWKQEACCQRLLGNKEALLSAFLTVLPKDQWLAAAQAATLLLPDENREVLQTLLYFLSDIASAEENQMTAGNLAVCLAPSIFHLNVSKKDNPSPR